MNKLLTPDELSEKLNIPKKWIYEKTNNYAQNPLPHYKVGKYLRFDLGEVLSWAKQNGKDKETQGHR